MRGCGDKMRSYEEVANLFNNKFPTRDPISKSTVHRTVLRFERTGLVTDEQRSGRPKTRLLMMMCLCRFYKILLKTRTILFRE